MTAPTWPGQWAARWIWAGPLPGAPAIAVGGAGVPQEAWNRFCFLRRTFRLGAVPATAPARATADSRFVLYVNGEEMARGPVRSIPERLAFEEVDLAAGLRVGENVVAAIVRYYGRPGPWWRPAAPDGWLGFGSFAFECPALDLRSDGSWRGRPAPYQREAPTPFHGVAIEIVDGADLDSGWMDAAFDADAAGWESATELGAGWPALGRTVVGASPFGLPEPAGIARRTSEPVALAEADRDASVLVGGDVGDPIQSYRPAEGGPGDPLRVFDAGRIVLATPWVEVTGPPRALVDVYAGEDRRADGVVEVLPREYALRYRLRGGADGAAPERIEGFEAVGFRYLGVAARGGARVVAVGATERRYPTGPGADFACDDERLTRIWRVGARTLEVCSTDAFLDCPGREQRAWLGDAYVHALVTYVTNVDWRLVRRHLRIGAQSRRGDGLLAMAAVGDLSLMPLTIPDYSLHWLRTLAAYVLHSGDVDLGHELLPVAAGVLEAFERHREPDGLLHDVPGWIFVDWAATERAEVVGAVDALLALALDDYAALVDAVSGWAAEADDARQRADRSRAALDALWDEDRGMYVDAADRSGPRRRVSQQTNAMAILARPADRARSERILDAILDPERIVLTPTTADMPPGRDLFCQFADPGTLSPFDPEVNVVGAQPFFSHFVHQAVVAAGRADLIRALCLRWWAQVERGNTTFEEYWNAPSGRASRAHAWSATPTYDLTTHVLGVRPGAPGYGTVVVDPHLEDLRWARGSVPTPHGLVEVELRPGGGRVVAPPGVDVKVTAPDVEVAVGEDPS